MKTARKALEGTYGCAYEWPDDCLLQCGDDGLVHTPTKGSYQCSYFEIVANTPYQTFLRGEGKNIEEAEKNCWQRWQNILLCKNHEYEHRGLDGHGICKNCGLFRKNVLEPIAKCHICGKKRYSTIDDVHYCKEHYAETDKGKEHFKALEMLFGKK